jgi:hypothetical protein
MSILASNHPDAVDNTCNGTTQKATATVAKALAVPFAAKDVHFKPAAINGNRALAIAYVDARAIQERLDSVLGMDGWQDEYTCLPNGSVVCTLRVRINDEWIAKIDVGSPSAQSDEGDRIKAAFSDALKRAAVKFGIGRYLYQLAGEWVEYDPKRRQFVLQPRLPAWAIPTEPTQNGSPKNGTVSRQLPGSR